MKERVIKVIAESAELNPKDIKPESNLVTDLGIESLDLVNLVVAFEDEFGVEIPDNDIKNLHTVQDVIDYASKNIKANDKKDEK